jgi:Predicted AAA-ATPase/PD-(D/E)XK nuclease superfamily
MQLPIGYDFFPAIRRHCLDFVDKSLLIQEILDNVADQVTVITRPRRFGKTLNLSMLHCFLAAEVSDEPTKDLFHGLKIADLGERYWQHQGKYPVILVNFKDIKGASYVKACCELKALLSAIYREHQYLLSSPRLTRDEQEAFHAVLKQEAEDAVIQRSLLDLTYYLYKHHGVRPWLLIDEYDTPIQTAYLCGYYSEMVQLIRGLFSNALKGNPSLERAVITGILRIAKESLFSGLNNVQVYTIFDSTYRSHFGFTEEEVESLLKQSGLSAQSADIRQWYNGYRIGGEVIYNPWSLVNCIREKGLLQPYWVNTSSNDLIRHLLARGDESIKMDLESIIRGESITALIDENMVFGDLEKDRNTLWSLLLFSGYFKLLHVERKGVRRQCELAVPNQEILALYQDVIRGWLSEALGNDQYLLFLLSLTEGRVEEFTHRLQRYLVEIFSVFDISGQNPEKFYHGFVLGMMVSLSETHEVKSNRESGYGRYDVLLIPKDPEQLGLVLEFKTVFDDKIDLSIAAEQGMQQINERNYAAELRQRGVTRILKMALAFRGKQVQVLPQIEEFVGEIV